MDGASECLDSRTGTQGPFRVAVRSSAAVDRGGAAVAPHSSACLEFAPARRAVAGRVVRRRRSSRAMEAAGAGRSAPAGRFRIRRRASRGWGRAEMAFSEPESAAACFGCRAGGETAWWMLSLFHPAADDAVDWQRGNYALTTRGGRVESDAGWGEVKKRHAHGRRRIGDGGFRPSLAARSPTSRRRTLPHPVYRAGFALAIPIPLKVRSRETCRMKYRVTCLTPTLVGDGQKLSPIDYMVWKDHVNVLDQRRIFRLLAKGPRLDGYLAQLKKADKLDFASWGGFAQNFAGRRIPFEHPSAIPFWERARAENLFIPPSPPRHAGPYLPGDRDQRRAAHRRGVRSLDRSDAARSFRAPRRGTSAAESGHQSWRTFPEPGVWLGRRFSTAVAHAEHESVSAARLDADRARSRKVSSWDGSPCAGRRMRGTSTTARRFSRRWPRPGRRSKELGRRSRRRIGRGSFNPPTATRPRSWRATSSTPSGPASRGSQPRSRRSRRAWARLQASQNACLLSVGWGGGMHRKVAYARHGR